MNIIEVATNIFINPDEVVSIEHDGVNRYTPSGGFISSSFNGSRITLKNGRKVFVDGVMPKEIIAKLSANEDKESR